MRSIHQRRPVATEGMRKAFVRDGRAHWRNGEAGCTIDEPQQRFENTCWWDVQLLGGFCTKIKDPRIVLIRMERVGDT
jgi:hypothetical protein